MAQTTYVMGEFPWRVKVGETVQCADLYCAAEDALGGNDPDEVCGRWHATRRAGDLAGFRAAGTGATAAEGVFANQPSPFARPPRKAWMLFLVLLRGPVHYHAAVALNARNERVFTGSYRFAPREGGEPTS
jgi:hypothetical protein